MSQPIPTREKEKEKDRRSKTGMSGSPKKGGAGGKGTWGVGGKDDLIQTPIDPRDPNYDPEEAEEVVLQQRILTKMEVAPSPIEGIIHEYFISGELEEVAKSIKEWNEGSAYDEFIKKAIRAALEKQAYERELISKLFSTLYGNTFTIAHLEQGFQLALNALPDFQLDTPDAADLLGRFIARGIFDEIVPPSFLKNATVLNKLTSESLSTASGLVTENHRSARLAHIWGPGDLGSVKRLKEESDLILQEYLSTSDATEADKCIRKLNAPSFLAQFVKQAVRLSLQRDAEARKKISNLLLFLYKSSLVSPYHLTRGFTFVKDLLPDITLDIPNAATLFNEMVQFGKTEGYLSNF